MVVEGGLLVICMSSEYSLYCFDSKTGVHRIKQRPPRHWHATRRQIISRATPSQEAGTGDYQIDKEGLIYADWLVIGGLWFDRAGPTGVENSAYTLGKMHMMGGRLANLKYPHIKARRVGPLRLWHCRMCLTGSGYWSGPA